MFNLKYKIKNNKLEFVFMCLFIVVLLFDLFVIGFDIFQFIKLSQNAADRLAAFGVLNIIAGVLSCVAILLILIYLIVKKLKLKTNVKSSIKNR